MTTLLWIFVGIIIILIVYRVYKIFHKQKKTIETQNQNYTKLLSQKKSSEVRLGQISEHLTPFLEGFSHNPKDTKFLGQPIDLICFEENKIIFIEVKTGNSQLSPKQKNIKELINNKQVFWEEFRISGKKEDPDKPKNNQP